MLSHVLFGEFVRAAHNVRARSTVLKGKLRTNADKQLSRHTPHNMYICAGARGGEGVMDLCTYMCGCV